MNLNILKTEQLRKPSYEGSKPFSKLFKYLKNDSKFLNFMFKTWNFVPFKIIKDGVYYFIQVNAVHPENHFSNFDNRMVNYKDEIKKNELIMSSLDDQINSLIKKVVSIEHEKVKLNRRNSYIERLFNSDSYEKPSYD